MPGNKYPSACRASGRIGMIMPYFGSWPRWLPLFLESCRCNENVDWFFYTDCEPLVDAPTNVKFKKMSLGEFRDLISAKLGLDAALNSPFKVCDFRPAYGAIFAEELASYQFWGWGDTDVILGNVREIVTASILAKYDVISARSGFLAGEFTLIRNCPFCCDLFRESQDFERIFTSASSFNFSEYGFFKDRPIDSMTHVVKRIERMGRLRAVFDDLGRTDRKLKGRPFRYYWHRGQLVDADSGEALLLYHFLERKRCQDFAFLQSPLHIEHGIEITGTGAVECRQPLQVRQRPLRIVTSQIKRMVRRVRARYQG